MALLLPQEFQSYMQGNLGTAFQDFLEALEKTPPVSIRYNLKKNAHPAGEPIPWCTSGRYLKERPAFTLDPLLHGGAYYVQEASSMFLEQALQQTADLTQPLNVLDLCAAPGGKSTHLLSLLSTNSLLVSNEVIRSRAAVLSENIQKWGHSNVVVTNNDPVDFQRLPGFFDIILVDAPCSGEGLFRKEPEATSQWSEKNVELCSLRQQRILTDVWPALKPGGILIYSTCTYNEHENMENIERLHAQASMVSKELILPDSWGIETLRRGNCTGYQLYPHLLKGEGFFMSVMQKADGPTRILKSKDFLHYPSRSQSKEISNWIKEPEEQCLFQHFETVRMLPLDKKDELSLLLQNLHVVIAGTAVLEITRNKLIPDHALALSININKMNFPVLPLNPEQALTYLRKDTLNVSAADVGFALIEYEGIGLGWVNVLPNRLNNLYPAAWRIRMGSALQ